MARVNVYLPDELAAAAKTAGLNISKVTQEALSESIAQSETEKWLDHLEGRQRVSVPHARVIEAIDEARAELERASSV